MKRGIIFLLFLLVLPLVSAQQNLVIFGLSLPLTIAAPLILIVILILFFLIVYLKDKLPNITKDFSKLKGIHFKSKKEEQGEKKRIITKDYLKEINKIEKNIPILSVEDLFNSIDPIMRDFFSKTFDIPYGFTYSELDEEMEKKKENIGNLTEKLSKLKYSGLECTKTNIRDVIEHLKVIIRKHYAPLPKEKQSLFKKIDLIQKIKVKLHHKRIEKEEDNIRNLINRGRLLIHKDLPLAMKTYLRSLLLYYKLPIRKKREIHIDLEQFHRELKKTGKHKKELSNLTKKIINLKHAGKQISVEGINLINRITDSLKTEEVLIKDRIEEAEKEVKRETKKELRSLSKALIIKPYEGIRDTGVLLDNKIHESINSLIEKSNTGIKNIYKTTSKDIETGENLISKGFKGSVNSIVKSFKKIKLPHWHTKESKLKSKLPKLKLPKFDKKHYLDVKQPKTILPNIKEKIKSLLNVEKDLVRKIELIKKQKEEQEKRVILEKTIKLQAPTLKLKHELLKIAQPQIPKEKLTKNIMRLRHERSLIYKQLKNLEEMEKKQQQAGTFIRFRG